MKIILHGTSQEDGLNYLALRTGLELVKEKPGKIKVLSFENGEEYAAKRNLMSVSVWKQ